MTDDTTPEGGQRELCAHCGGNGVVKLVGGVSVCPRCRGECYEPGCSRCAAQSSRLRSLEQELVTERRLRMEDGHTAIKAQADLASLEQRLRDLEGALKAVTEHMDRAGGDGYGMPECPWCRAQGSRDGDENYHNGDCELAAARAILSTLIDQG
jgi:hypothetical protein